MSNQDERAAFEAWADGREGYGAIGRSPDWSLGAVREAWEVWQARAALSQPVREPSGSNWHAHHVAVNKGALQMIRNALRTDVEKGLKVRGEMLAELDAATFVIPAPGSPVNAREPMSEEERWSAYFEGDERVTVSDSEGEAVGEMQFQIDNDSEPGDEIQFCVAPMLSAKQALRKRSGKDIGEDVFERINELLSDDMGAEEWPLDMTKDEQEQLGQQVVEFICQHSKTQWWTIDAKREQKRTYIAVAAATCAQAIRSMLSAAPVCWNCDMPAPGCGGLFASDGAACEFHGGAA